LRAAEQDRPDVARHRRRFRVWQRFMDPARFVFLDETAASTTMIRRSGWAPVGQRLIAAVPFGHWHTTTCVAGLRQSGIVAPHLISGPMTRSAFLTYVQEHLAPCLSAGDVVVMDNLSAHKSPAVIRAIRAVGASTLYLPPYSPDLNPIELAFSKLKALLRAAAARTREALWQSVQASFAQFTPEECANYLRHCGYDAP